MTAFCSESCGLFSKLIPFRFMGVLKFKYSNILNILAKIGVIPFIYAIFGVFVVTKGKGIEEGIKEAKQIISEKGVVVIFPEGQLTDGKQVYEFKKGAAALALATGAPVLPVALRKTDGVTHINIGTRFEIDPSSTWDSATELFKGKVTELFEGAK